jgi:predicted AAA+ superfamily ATPase
MLLAADFPESTLEISRFSTILSPNLKWNFKFVQMVNNSLINRAMALTMGNIFRYLPVITLTGPRQSGKTTLCRKVFASLPYANLEDASTLAEARKDPKAFLAKYPQGVIMDEAQNFPEIFSYLQVAVDEDRMSGNERRFIVTGSNNFSLMQRITQSMAGRTAVMSLLPLSTEEIMSAYPDAKTSEMLLCGGYPAIWSGGLDGRQILLSNYYTTYIERDVRSLVNVKDLQAFQMFIRLAAGRIGQEFNASALSIEVGVSVPTIKNWLSVLSASYVVYLLQPYYANIGKRLAKTPKLYFYDTGLASFLLGINTVDQMEVHPLRGNLFENMVLNDMLKHGANLGRQETLFFYRDKSQREVDILRLMPEGTLEAYEVKAGMTFSVDYFKHLHYLQSLLGERLKRTAVVYDGNQENPQTIDGYCNFRHLRLEP